MKPTVRVFMTDSGFEEVPGKIIILPEWKEFSFGIHHFGKGWRISEQSTGTAIAEGNTQKETIQQAAQVLEKAGKAAVIQAIEDRKKDTERILNRLKANT